MDWLPWMEPLALLRREPSNSRHSSRQTKLPAEGAINLAAMLAFPGGSMGAAGLPQGKRDPGRLLAEMIADKEYANLGNHRHPAHSAALSILSGVCCG
jgi:hypothetical protein